MIKWIWKNLFIWAILLCSCGFFWASGTNDSEVIRKSQSDPISMLERDNKEETEVHLIRQVSVVKERCIDLEDENTELKTSFDKFKADNERLQYENTGLQMNYITFQVDYTELQENNKDLHLFNNELIDINRELKNRIESLEIDLKNSKEKFNTINGFAEKFKKKNNDNSIEPLEQKDKVISDLNNKISILEKENKKLEVYKRNTLLLSNKMNVNIEEKKKIIKQQNITITSMQSRLSALNERGLDSTSNIHGMQYNQLASNENNLRRFSFSSLEQNVDRTDELEQVSKYQIFENQEQNHNESLTRKKTQKNIDGEPEIFCEFIEKDTPSKKHFYTNSNSLYTVDGFDEKDIESGSESQTEEEFINSRKDNKRSKDEIQMLKNEKLESKNKIQILEGEISNYKNKIQILEGKISNYNSKIQILEGEILNYNSKSQILEGEILNYRRILLGLLGMGFIALVYSFSDKIRLGLGILKNGKKNANKKTKNGINRNKKIGKKNSKRKKKNAKNVINKNRKIGKRFSKRRKKNTNKKTKNGINRNKKIGKNGKL